MDNGIPDSVISMNETMSITVDDEDQEEEVSSASISRIDVLENERNEEKTNIRNFQPNIS